ncbi:MAG: SRPBCC family protein [Planctomycetota bacterium]
MRMTMSTHIDADPDTVFEATTRFATAADFIGGIDKVEMLTDGPVGVGTRFRETRTFFGKTATEVMEVTDFRPGESYTLGAASNGCIYQTIVRCVPEDGGTRLEYDFSGEPQGLIGKLTAPLMALALGGTMRKCLAKDLEDIKASVESGGDAPESAALA